LFGHDCGNRLDDSDRLDYGSSLKCGGGSLDWVRMLSSQVYHSLPAVDVRPLNTWTAASCFPSWLLSLYTGSGLSAG
jgi:hypothetical protein